MPDSICPAATIRMLSTEPCVACVTATRPGNAAIAAVLARRRAGRLRDSAGDHRADLEERPGGRRCSDTEELPFLCARRHAPQEDTENENGGRDPTAPPNAELSGHRLTGETAISENNMDHTGLQQRSTRRGRVALGGWIWCAGHALGDHGDDCAAVTFELAAAYPRNLGQRLQRGRAPPRDFRQGRIVKDHVRRKFLPPCLFEAPGAQRIP